MRVLRHDRKTKRSRWIDLVQYVAVSLLIIGLVGILFYAGMSLEFFSKWGALVGFSVLVGWSFVSPLSNKKLRSRDFWFLSGIILAVHIGVWIFVLRRVEIWKPSWFVVPMLLENALLQRLKHSSHRGILSSKKIDFLGE